MGRIDPVPIFSETKEEKNRRRKTWNKRKMKRWISNTLLIGMGVCLGQVTGYMESHSVAYLVVAGVPLYWMMVVGAVETFRKAVEG